MADKIKIEVANKLAERGYVEVVKRAKNGRIQEIIKYAVNKLDANNKNNIDFSAVISKAISNSKDLKAVRKSMLEFSKDIKTVADDVKDVANQVVNLTNVTKLATKLSWINIGLQVAGMVETAVCFEVVNEKLNEINRKIESMTVQLNKLSRKSDLDIKQKYKNIRMEYIEMLDCEKRGDIYDFDKKLFLAKEMSLVLDYLYECFMCDAANDASIVLDGIYALLPMYSNVLSVFDREYYFEKRSAEGNQHMAHKDWMNSISQLRSREFLDKLQDYCFLDKKCTAREANDAVNTTYLIALSAEVAIEDNMKIIECLESIKEYRQFTGEIQEEAISDVRNTIPEIDEQVLELINPSYRTMNQQTAALRMSAE